MSSQSERIDYQVYGRLRELILRRGSIIIKRDRPVNIAHSTDDDNDDDDNDDDNDDDDDRYLVWIVWNFAHSVHLILKCHS